MFDTANDELEQRLEQRRALWLEEQRLARERRDRIAAAIARASELTSHLEAIEVLEAARALDPSDTEITRLLADRRASLVREEEAAQRAREREAAIAAALAAAETTDDHRSAIQLLRRALSLDEHHVALREQLAARERARDKEDAEARQARERANKIAGMLAAAAQEPSHEAAMAILQDALKLDGTNAEIARRVDQRRAAWQEEVQRARELREKIAEAITQASALPSHLDAIRVLTEAQALDPEDGDIRRSLSERRAAHDREQREARQAQERDAAIAAALATAAATDSHEAAVEILEHIALTLDPAHTEVQQQLAVRRAARDRAGGKARARGPRADRRSAQTREAHHIDEHAIAILREAQAQDPSHQQLREALEAREAALQRTRADAKRLQDIGIARQRILI